MVHYLHNWAVCNKHETSINNTTTLLSLLSIFIDTSDSLPSLDAVTASLAEAKLTHQRMEETRGRNGEDRGGYFSEPLT